ncbi:Palmitoyltransferase ZDHHC3 [Papilio xuthus]|uniref:Palmitoyltransferase ZDHHC3 n=1 Tax=Papilio xuthus TaxID=66420 RepID=A0A194PTR8_PAPXU|nr:Palmitoyltransferase ZDHHC3 [Papilio xuthus]
MRLGLERRQQEIHTISGAIDAEPEQLQSNLTAIEIPEGHDINVPERGIEQLKKEQARWVRKSRWMSIQAVFGRFSILWFSPFTQPSVKTKLESYLYSV